MQGTASSVPTDDIWVDSTPVECAQSRETVQHSELAELGRVQLPRSWGLHACGLHPAGTPAGLGGDRRQGRERETLNTILALHRL